MGIIKNKKFNRKNLSGARAYRRPLVFNGNKFKSHQENKKPLLRKIWQPAFALIFIVSVLYIFFYSQYFRIDEIIIQGNSLVSEQMIAQNVPNNSNIFLFNSSRAKESILRNNPEIKHVEIVRGIPNAVKIVVLEHENKLIWESNGTQYLLSSQGLVTKKINPGEAFSYPRVVDSKNIPVDISSSIVSPSFVSFVVNINNKISEITNLSPSYFQVNETTFDLNLYTTSGIYIKFNTMRSSAKQLDNLKQVLVSKKSEIKEYVDLRIDGLAYFK